MVMMGEGRPDRVLTSAEDERCALGVVVGVHVDPRKADNLTHVAPHQNFGLDDARRKMHDERTCMTSVQREEFSPYIEYHPRNRSLRPRRLAQAEVRGSFLCMPSFTSPAPPCRTPIPPLQTHHSAMGSAIASGGSWLHRQNVRRSLDSRPPLSHHDNHHGRPTPQLN